MNNIEKMTIFQKTALTGIMIVIILTVTIIIMFAISLTRNDVNTPSPDINTKEPILTSQNQPEKSDNQTTPCIVEVSKNRAQSGNLSVGTRLGKAWNSGSHKVYEVLTDFNEEVKVTDFFRTGYREFFDAIRADSDEEFIEITISRLANKNSVSVVNVTINDDDSINVEIESDCESSAEDFRRALEKLSFVAEAIYNEKDFTEEGLFLYKIDFFLNYVAK